MISVDKGYASSVNELAVQNQGLEPSDPRADDLWAPDYIGAFDAWEISTGEGIVVAVIDTGVDVDHVDLDDNMWTNPGEIAGDGIDNDGNGFVDDIHGWNFSSSGAADDLTDRHSHGTHVAGIVAAEADNDKGAYGIAPDAEIMAVKALNDQGGGTYSDIAAGIDYAIENGAQIINLSLSGGAAGSSVLRSAIGRAEEAGVIIVAAAGNSAKSEAEYPAYFTSEFDNVISVAAMADYGKLAPYSNKSSTETTVDLAAPGSGVLSTTPGDKYGYKSGTSMATPVVAAAAAVIWSAQPTWSYLQVIETLEATVNKLPSLESTSTTNGMLDLAAAMDLAMAGSQNNAAPALEVDTIVDSIAEGSATPSGGLRIATLTVTDDGVGVAVLDLKGPDASDFEIRGDGLYLREGVVLDFETRPELRVTITVDDPDLAGGPEASRKVVLAVDDVAEGPSGPTDAAAPDAFSDLEFWFDATGLSAGATPGTLQDLSENDHTASASKGERGSVEDGGLSFDGGDVYTISGSDMLNTEGPYEAKTLSFSLETGSDIDSQQFVYEQGGNQRGLSVTIEDGELHMTGWNLRGEKWNATTVSTSISKNDEMAVSLVLDAEAGTLSGYVDGELIGVESGVGELGSHDGGIALGGVSNRTRDADGSSVRTEGGSFEGTIYEASSHGQALDAAEIEMVHAGFAEGWGATSASHAVVDDVDTFILMAAPERPDTAFDADGALSLAEEESVAIALWPDTMDTFL